MMADRPTPRLANSGIPATGPTAQAVPLISMPPPPSLTLPAPSSSLPAPSDSTATSNRCQILLEDPAGNTYLPKVHYQFRGYGSDDLPPTVAQAALLTMDISEDGNIENVTPVGNKPVTVHNIRVINDPSHRHSTIAVNVSSPLLQSVPMTSSTGACPGPRVAISNSLDQFKKKNVEIRDLLFDSDIRDLFASTHENKQVINVEQQHQSDPLLSTSPASTAINRFLMERIPPRPEPTTTTVDQLLPELRVRKKVAPISIISHNYNASSAETARGANAISPKASPFKERSHSWTPPPTMDAYYVQQADNNDPNMPEGSFGFGDDIQRHHHRQRHRQIRPHNSSDALADIREDATRSQPSEQLQIDVQNILKNVLDEVAQTYLNTVGSGGKVGANAEDFKKGVVRSLLLQMESTK